MPVAALKQIARAGHIYAFPRTYGAFAAGGSLHPKLVGIRRASTFSGFCSTHDSSFFAPIETQELCACQLHAFLLAFRATSYELYAKEAGVISTPGLRDFDRGLPAILQAELQSAISDNLTGFKAGLDDVLQTKDSLDDMHRKQDLSEIEFCVFWLDRPPGVMCCGSDTPLFDFHAVPLQDLGNLGVRMEGLTCSIVAAGQRGCAFFSWAPPSRSIPRAFLFSLLSQERGVLPHVLLRYVLTNFENLYLSPDWWEAVDPSVREFFVRRLTDIVHPDTPINPRILLDDGIRVAPWKVTGFESNVPALTSAWNRDRPNGSSESAV